MPDKKKKKATIKPNSKAPPAKPAGSSKHELDDRELDAVSGGAGKVNVSDMSFTIRTDKSSP